ncbi:MAG: nucleotidyltransferase domain-containing protein [Candidatus Berkelbacteria bacterium]|nr:nucleotidyltransferase domain-containing protein [Candidatus Berkelbacteria bacterium]
MFAKLNFFEKRLKRLTGLGYLLQLAPFVKAVILTGSMTRGDDSLASDIDLLIITSPKRLYTARFFATFWTALTGWRRKPLDKNPAGKFCLNYYLSSDNLDIKPRTANCARHHRHLIRIWDRGGELEKIYRQNFWLYNHNIEIVDKEKVSKLKKVFPLDRLLTFSILRRPWEWILSGRIGGKLERVMSNWQMKKITNSEQHKANKKTIIVLPNELRSHPKK